MNKSSFLEHEVFYEINKSKYYSYCFDVNSLEEFENIYKQLKLIHKKATHICYAYKINENNQQKTKAFDDGEPKGTAGYPILKILETKQKNNVTIFVVRYFGGIKLGSSGLLRSYLKSATLAYKKNFD